MLVGKDGTSEVKERTDISGVLDDLGYSANDLMNVNFVFIVEGKQDVYKRQEKVQEVLEEAYGCPYTEVFEQIEPIPQGSASIAQVHRAVSVSYTHLIMNSVAA